ncbi:MULTISPECIES: DUF2607 family protein [Shewanella]|uniref:DUF2946 domain-containing protein n=3 Tax=Shewanella putrefaciens TaxID=24 RepID=E6XJZ6_SHEP2|nr:MULTISPECIES: DUF2607 family protein [Shewanella]CAD6363877.1 hypothetical protein SHEWT2_00198 [Shewanella hafniensis]ABM23871.1 conserved hypothetical protein [Shewanella sp. W3-18-1]AVV85650.1 hypothetical protein SPWS13_3972 [Shewanella putrefaciens]MCA1895441.1 DUF2607 family protein [Shewanella putrefaciens]MCK7631305.1 DUF2607 family protein [Shewanella sp. JNE9-1]
MNSVMHTRRTLAIWLVAILVLLSVASAVHSVSHLKDDSTTHCALCLHQHQTQHALTSTPFHFQLSQQSYIRVEFQVVSFEQLFSRFFNSRAPPITA